MWFLWTFLSTLQSLAACHHYNAATLKACKLLKCQQDCLRATGKKLNMNTKFWPILYMLYHTSRLSVIYIIPWSLLWHNTTFRLNISTVFCTTDVTVHFRFFLTLVSVTALYISVFIRETDFARVFEACLTLFWFRLSCEMDNISIPMKATVIATMYMVAPKVFR